MTEPVARSRPGWDPAAVVAGILASVMTVVVALSLASLVFAGPLASVLPLASIAILAVAAAMNLVLARVSSLPGSIMIPQDATSAIMATALAAALVGLTVESAISTAVLALGLSTMVTALVMMALGTSGMGALVRYIPYPVMGGFLAATGVLLLIGGADLMTSGFDWSPATAISLVSGAGLGLALLIIAGRRMHPMILPGVILGAIAVFYGVLIVFGVSLAEAREMGLLSRSPGSVGLPSVSFGPIDWATVVSLVPAIITVPIVAVVSLLLNVGGLELVADRDVDLDQELRAAGLANLFGVAGAAPAGYHAISLSAFGFRAGVASRSVSAIVGLVCVVGAVLGPVLVSYLPVPVVGSLLAMLGFSFLSDWLLGGYRRMSHVEYLLMLVICVGLVVLGFLIGIAFGLAAAVLLFAATYSRLDPIRYTFTGAERSSSVERSVTQRQRLDEAGAQVRVVELEGFLFFGTAYDASRAIARMLQSDTFRALVVDMRRVQGLDSTAALAFAKLNRELMASGIALVISHASAVVEAALVRAGLSPAVGVVYVQDIDHALEYCEELLLEGIDGESGNPWLLPEKYWQRLLPHMERIEVQAGEMLAEFGEYERCVFIVESGRVAAEIPVGPDRWQRVRSAGPGGVLGEVSMYGDGHRTARLRAEEGGVVLRLSPEAVADLEASDPGCAIAFHRALVRALSQRLVTSNDFIRALVR